MRAYGSVIAYAMMLCACRHEPTPDPRPPVPDARQVRSDLVGATFSFYDDADGARPWTIGADELRDVQLVDTTARADGARVRVRVVLAASQRTIRGLLDLDYRLADDRWALRSVERAGPNFFVGDAAFVLYDVSAVPSDSLFPDRLALDVIAQFADGAWTAPLDRRAAPPLAPDGSVPSDSLRDRVATQRADSIRQAWLPTGRAVRVWSPGRAPRTVTIDSAEVGVDGCTYAVGWAQGRADATALGSTSSVLGNTRVRAPSARDVRALDRLAATRLDTGGGRRLRSTGALAADLDGDGTDELVGSYAVGADTLAVAGLVVAARMASDGARLLFERLAEPGRERMTLVGVADLDADGAAEVIVREEGAEAYGYRIVTFRAGRFVDAFRGGGGGC